MMVFLLHPVSSRRSAVSSMMVRGDRSHSRPISFHSLSDRLICFMWHPSSQNWYTLVYLKRTITGAVCQ